MLRVVVLLAAAWSAKASSSQLKVRSLVKTPDASSSSSEHQDLLLVWYPGGDDARQFGDSEACEWHDYVSKRTGEAAEMCLRATKEDVVSEDVKSHKYWGDCSRLVDLYAEQRGSENRTGLFVDVGANVGACTVEMLLAFPKLLVVAVEPSPSNLFYLTQTLEKNAKTLGARDRAVVLTVAAGNRSSVENVAVVGDSANSQIDEEDLLLSSSSSSSSKKKQKTVHYSSPLRRLDDLVKLSVNSWSAATRGELLRFAPTLVKMDARGYECWALAGMPDLLKHVKVVRPDIETSLLEKQRCGSRPWTGAESLVRRLADQGFVDLETADGSKVLSTDLLNTLFLASAQCKRGSCDFAAKKKSFESSSSSSSSSSSGRHHAHHHAPLSNTNQPPETTHRNRPGHAPGYQVDAI